MIRLAIISMCLALTGLTACGQGTGLPTDAGKVKTDGLQLNSVFGDGFQNSNDEGKPLKIKNPTIADIMKTGALPDRSMGRADAPITIVEYASLTCRFCRKFHRETFPVLKRQYIDTGKVRFILREFPIGRTSGTAWIATRCANPSKYFALYTAYLDKQHLWVSQEIRREPIFKVASKLGMSREKFNKCLSNQSIIDGLTWIKERGRQLGVFGTPSFFINGERVSKIISTGDLRAKLDSLLAHSG